MITDIHDDCGQFQTFLLHSFKILKDIGIVCLGKVSKTPLGGESIKIMVEGLKTLTPLKFVSWAYTPI